MDFLRLQGVPIPKVLAWSSSSSSSNSAGFEYIVMEKVPGNELEETWYTMNLKQRMAIMDNIIKMEKILFGIRFPANGSIYYKGYLDSKVSSVDIPLDNLNMAKFCTGPYTEYLWWFQQRSELSTSPGPC
jgi:hypothetical protein